RLTCSRRYILQIMTIRRGLLIIALLTLLAGCKKEETTPTAASSQPGSPTEVRIAAAADLQFALADLIKSFEQAHPEIRVWPTYGSSGNFFSQLSNKAPFDVFLSADASYPQKLVDQGLAQSSMMFRYATGKIVLWAPRESPLDLKTLG